MIPSQLVCDAQSTCVLGKWYLVVQRGEERIEVYSVIEHQGRYKIVMESADELAGAPGSEGET